MKFDEKFNEEFITKIDDDPVGAVVEACLWILDHQKGIFQETTDKKNEWTKDVQDLLMETASLVFTIIENKNLHGDRAHQIAPPTRDVKENCSSLRDYIITVRNEFEIRANELQMKSYKNKFQTLLNCNFAYEFSQGDLDRIQVLIDELRTQINDSILEPEYKLRLLKRLEKLQSEMHKRVSSLDHHWGLVGEAGVILGKLGTDAKPLVDCIKEIAKIGWRTQARTEELPSNSLNPLLEDNDQTKP